MIAGENKNSDRARPRTPSRDLFPSVPNRLAAAAAGGVVDSPHHTRFRLARLHRTV